MQAIQLDVKEGKPQDLCTEKLRKDRDRDGMLNSIAKEEQIQSSVTNAKLTDTNYDHDWGKQKPSAESEKQNTDNFKVEMNENGNLDRKLEEEKVFQGYKPGNVLNRKLEENLSIFKLEDRHTGFEFETSDPALSTSKREARKFESAFSLFLGMDSRESDFYGDMTGNSYVQMEKRLTFGDDFFNPTNFLIKRPSNVEGKVINCELSATFRFQGLSRTKELV